MAKLDGTKTLENLKKAFSGEAQAHTKYQFYSSKAKKEGYNKIASIFDETAKNEKEHAKLWFKAMHGDDIPVTTKNLLDAIQGETYEYSSMYKEFAETAQEEGFDDIANLFRMVAEIELTHSQNYEKLLKQLENDELFNTNEPILWICTNCGHIHKGNKPPLVCPVCKHPQGYFVRKHEI